MNTVLNKLQVKIRPVDTPAATLYHAKYFHMRRTALAASIMGAVCSLALMLRVGRHQPSLLLLTLFTGWVVSPFIAMVAATARSKRWARPALLITTASIAVYSYAAFGPPMAKPASVFLMVPLGSWLLLAIAIPVTTFLSAGKK